MMLPVHDPIFSLRLFGSIDLRGPSGALDGLAVQSKAVALLAYLSLPSVGRFTRRDTLVGLLWPDLDQTRARKALRQTIHQIRTETSEECLIGRGDEEIALAPEWLWCDAAAFIHATDEGYLDQALEYYSGELMPGFYLANCGELDRWLENQRTELRERASAAAWALAQRLESTHQLSDAAGMARRSIRFSWSDERALRRALLMLDRLGDRAGAARLYEDFRRRLATELDVAPSDETAQLISRIRNV
jgi:serine/threonine-protein kinase